MLRLWPHRLRGDGHFVARLRKAGTRRAARRPDPPGSTRTLAGYLDALEREACRLPEFIRAMEFFVQGDRLYCRPADAPQTRGLKVVSPGLCLARLGRNHLEPEHALAMALPPECALRTASLDDAAARAWLRGEAIADAGEKGWALALWRGMPLGWGKRSDGLLKNHMPKGLRRPR